MQSEAQSILFPLFLSLMTQSSAAQPGARALCCKLAFAIKCLSLGQAPFLSWLSFLRQKQREAFPCRAHKTKTRSWDSKGGVSSSTLPLCLPAAKFFSPLATPPASLLLSTSCLLGLYLKQSHCHHLSLMRWGQGRTRHQKIFQFQSVRKALIGPDCKVLSETL